MERMEDGAGNRTKNETKNQVKQEETGVERMTNRKNGNAIKPQPETAAAAPAPVVRDPADASTYRILNRSEEEVTKALDIFQHNLRDQKLTERDMPRVKTPPQGITIWSVSGPEGDVHLEELTGILVEYTTPRAYWDKPLDPNTVTPPVCSSPDGIRGTKFGDCYSCAFSKFGSDPREESNGQACKEKRMLFLLRPENLLPLVVQAPSTSIRNVFDYVMGLGNQETPFEQVYTQLTLEKIGMGSVEYSKVILKAVGPVPEEYNPQVRSYQEGLNKLLGSQTLEITPDLENMVEQNWEDPAESQGEFQEGWADGTEAGKPEE